MEVKTYTITKIYRDDKDKEGNLLVSKKTMKPYTKCTIKTQETGDDYIYGFGSKTTDSWVEGAKVEIIVSSEEYNGKTSKKFQVPTNETRLEGRVAVLEVEVMNLKRMLTPNVQVTSTQVPNMGALTGYMASATNTPSPANLTEPEF